MKYSDIKQSVLDNFAISNKLVPNIVGKPGGGKSSLARDIIRTMGINPARVTEFNPSLRDPVDIMGIPRTTGEVAKWLPMEEFYRIRNDGTDEPCALIVEEISDAEMAMQNPLCRVILDNFAGELELHPKLYKVITGNSTEHKSGAKRLSTKLANRMQNLEFDENIDDWSDWALDAGIQIPLIQYLRFKPGMLSDFDPNRKINPTPRSWEMANYVNPNMPADRYFANIAGCVGEGAAAEFVGFRRIFEGLPNIDGILLNPSKSEVPTDPAVLYALAGALAHRVSKDNFDRVSEYSERMPTDFSVMLTLDAMKLKPEIKNTKAFVKWAVANSNVLI